MKMAAKCWLRKIALLYMLCVAIHSTQVMATTISVLTENSTVGVDMTALLTCVVDTESPDATVVHWTKDGTTLMNNSKVTVYGRQVEFEGSTHTQSTVEVCSVDFDDIGEYACLAVTGGASMQKTTQLNVVNTTVPAQIIALSSNESVLIHSTTFLTCVGYGVPTPTIRWEKGGVNLANSSQVTLYETEFENEGEVLTQSTVELCSVQVNDSGGYTCVVESGDTTNRMTTLLEVSTGTVSAQIIALSSNDTVLSNSTTFLTCVGYGVPTPTIRWEKGGVNLANSSQVTLYETEFENEGEVLTQSTVELCSVQVNDSGGYTCVVESGDTTNRMTTLLEVSTGTVSAQIIALSSNDTVLSNSTTFLTCVGYGVPTPTIRWENDGVNLVNNSQVTVYETTEFEGEGGQIFRHSTVELCGVQLEDSGGYTCIIESEDTSARMTTQLTVTDNIDPAQVILLSSNATVDVQTSVLLTCVGYANPVTTLTWVKDGGTVSNNSRITVLEREVTKGGKVFTQSSLELCNIQPYESGVYTCVAESGSTSHSLSTHLTVIGNATIVEPTTMEPTTEAPTTPAPATEAPTTPAPATEDSTTPEPTTEAPTTPEPTTEAPTTPEPTTEAPTTPEPTTEDSTTPEPTTEAPTTPAPATEDSTTPEPTTEASTTPEPTTEAPTTPEPTTEAHMTPQLMECSEAFQLLLGPINDCLEWKFTDPRLKADTILSTVMEQISNPQCSIMSPAFTCDTINYPNSVVLRAEITGQVGCNCDEAVQELSEWIDNGGSIIVDANQLNLDSTCDVRVTSITDGFVCNSDLTTNPSNVGDDSSRYIIVGASGGVVVITITLFIAITVGVLCSKARKRKSRNAVRRVSYFSGDGSMPRPAHSGSSWDPQSPPASSNAFQVNPCYQDAGCPNPIYEHIDPVVIEEKEKCLSLLHQDSRSSINPYELDYEMRSTFWAVPAMANIKEEKGHPNENENDAYVVMNPSSS